MLAQLCIVLMSNLSGGVAVSPGLQTITVTNLNNGVDFASLRTKGWIGHYQFAESLPLLPYEASYLDDRYVVVGHGNNLVHIFDTDGDFKEPVRTIEFPDLQYEYMSGERRLNYSVAFRLNDLLTLTRYRLRRKNLHADILHLLMRYCAGHRDPERRPSWLLPW